jgi:hypothetical protein
MPWNRYSRARGSLEVQKYRWQLSLYWGIDNLLSRILSRLKKVKRRLAAIQLTKTMSVNSLPTSFSMSAFHLCCSTQTLKATILRATVSTITIILGLSQDLIFLRDMMREEASMWRVQPTHRICLVNIDIWRSKIYPRKIEVEVPSGQRVSKERVSNIRGSKEGS